MTTISEEVKNAGFRIVALDGLCFKPFTDFQMDELINRKFSIKLHLDSLVELGKDYPDLCGYIFVCGEKIVLILNGLIFKFDAQGMIGISRVRKE